MKTILYLSHRIPYPPNKGDKIRSFNEIKYLSKRYKVDLITLADDPKDLKFKKNIEQYCRQVKVFPLNTKAAKIKGFFSLLTGHSISQGYFYSKAFQSFFNLWIKQQSYDALICFSSPMAEYVFKATQNKKPAHTLIMDFCDLDSDKWRQYAQKLFFPFNLIYKLETARLLTFEKKINHEFDHSVFVSSVEAGLFKKYYPQAKRLDVVTNGVDHDYFNPDLFSTGKKDNVMIVGFFGAMDYYANVDGALWFANHIWPLIKKQIPDALFFIVGSNPDPKLKALASDPSIQTTGFVEDIREYYHKTSVCVVPLRIARGVQNKVLEAMSMGKAIVSTSPAVQGIGAFDKPFISVEDDPKKFAACVINHLQDEPGRNEAGRKARKYIQTHYNWDGNIERLRIKCGSV
ncbi:TIGR03087 family PEP-CTERM/XrtA system glycosyltransferase [Desulfobacter sp.]|uniref:TIGR03087 family PEP-CTERM/XrtA system glycosyltransferase n=1 Tax=Desulfobacter sp. TaxID=2294 RepID=UPI003D1215EB